MSTILDRSSSHEPTPRRPRALNPTEMRDRVPALGLREYWYPALKAQGVGRRKPVGVKIMGETVTFFRGKDGQVKAMDNVCPHRGGSMMHGDCHYQGTVACPYHGWVFDEDGDCVAVLSEGPDSRIPGKVRIRTYPTRTLKGVVFVWMGHGQPAPIEEDVPPEFFEGPETLVITDFRTWAVNWRVALENALDSHFVYVHRNALLQLTQPILKRGPLGFRGKEINGRAVAGIPVSPLESGYGYRTEEAGNGQPAEPAPEPPYREYFPGVQGYWPKHRWRFLWLWAFKWAYVGRDDTPPFHADPEWGSRGSHHLPSMFRRDFRNHMYTRFCTPIDEDRSTVIYCYAVRRKSALGRLQKRVYYHLLWRWILNYNFSNQDLRVMEPQRYDTPEKLSGSDGEIIAWRKLLLNARGLPRLDGDGGPETT
jgi:phenylpropionate dioxygenase-like ring-hydroxylating dioxygenase large terminal subunit